MSVQLLPDKEPTPIVSFHMEKVENREASVTAGHIVYDDREMATITPHGGNLAVPKFIDDFSEHDWDRLQAHYDNWKAGLEPPEDGMPLRHWPLATDALLANASAAKIYTVEVLASANARMLQSLGLQASMWKDKAETWLKSAQDFGSVTEENSQLKVRVAQLEEIIERQTTDIDELKLAAGMGKRGPGRPRKN